MVLILALILPFQKLYGSNSQIVRILLHCSNNTITGRMNDQHKEFRVALLQSGIILKSILQDLFINLLLFHFVQYGKYGVVIGLEDLATCFLQARISRRQAKGKSVLPIALFLKLTKEKLNCLNSHKIRIGKS